MRRKTWWLGALLAFALVAAACGGTDDTTTTTGAEVTTTAAEATTTTEAEMAFEGASLAAESCDYGGKISSITATDEHTVVFDLCSADPAFLAKAAFVVFGIQPAEHLEATGGAPLRP